MAIALEGSVRTLAWAYSVTRCAVAGFVAIGAGATISCSSPRDDSVSGNSSAHAMATERAIVSARSTSSTSSSSTAPGSTATASGHSSHSTAAPSGAVEGSWQANFEATRSNPILDAGVVEPSWRLDRGERGTGKGRLEMAIDPGGALSGRAHGALGDLELTGLLDGEFARATIQPASGVNGADAFRGMLVARRVGDAFEGRLDVSSGDGRVVRTAKIRLLQLGR
jgi:hypothetical protein